MPIKEVQSPESIAGVPPCESPMDVKGQFGVDSDAARHDMKGSLEMSRTNSYPIGGDHFDEVGCSSERRAGKAFVGQRESGSRWVWGRPAAPRSSNPGVGSGRPPGRRSA